MSDQSGLPSRDRSADGGRPAPGAARQVSRSRLPLPPVPVAPARPRTPAGPRTTAAPFAAVPSPEPRFELDRDDAFPPASGRGSIDRAAGSAPAIARPSRSRLDAEPALTSTGPGKAGGFRSPLPPRVPRQTGPASAPSPAYGDWTKPSRSDEIDLAVDELSRNRRAAAPGTTAIPERRTSGRRRQPVAPNGDSIDHEFDVDADYELDQDIDRSYDEDRAPPPVRGPVSGPVVGGRAAMRAERQAADQARRKREKQTGSAVAVLDELEADGEVHKPRRVGKGLLAMTVVALGVLGVYSYVSPQTDEVAAQSPATTAPAIVPDATAPLPDLPTAPVDTATAPAAPVRAPLTVLNATDTTGMAAKASDAFKAAGWESAGVGGYTGG